MWKKRFLRTNADYEEMLTEVVEALRGEGLEVGGLEGTPNCLRVVSNSEEFTLRCDTLWSTLRLVGRTPYDASDGVEERDQSYGYGCKATTVAALIRKRAAARPAMREAYTLRAEESRRLREQAQLKSQREAEALTSLRFVYPNVVNVREFNSALGGDLQGGVGGGGSTAAGGEVRVFSWRGEPILDIKAWAEARGERMVPYTATREVPVGARMVTETQEGEMPESFWRGLVMENGWVYTEREVAP